MATLSQKTHTYYTFLHLLSSVNCHFRPINSHLLSILVILNDNFFNKVEKEMTMTTNVNLHDQNNKNETCMTKITIVQT